VEIPSVQQDKVQLGRVGIIALFGFGIGVLWPTLAGVKLVPRPPSDAPPAEPEAASAAPARSAVPPPTAAPPPAAPPESSRIKLGDAQVTSCQTDDGSKQKDCGRSPIDAVVRPHLFALAQCEAAADAAGLLSLGLEYDVARGRITQFLRGKSTTLSDAKAEALIGCAKEQLKSAAFDSVRPPLAGYTVFYPIELVKPAAEAAAAAGEGVTLASGVASVGWHVALIRSQPDKDGEIVARVLSGTRVSVTGRQGDWYRVKYDAKGSEGWVFRAAIGL
jgi:hypothetical protein